MFKSSSGSAVLAAIGLAGAALVAALGLASGGGGHRGGAGRSITATAAESAPAVLDVTITPESKPGPDGKRHDAYSQTEFSVRAGRPLTLRIDNTDSQPHSIISSTAHLAILVAPGVHNYTLFIRHRGRFRWRCFFNCDSGADGWAMTHAGYMSGYITAT